MDAGQITLILEGMAVRYWSFTAADKSFLKEVAKDEGLQVNERCPDCWRDLFLFLKQKYMKPKKQRSKKWEFVGTRTLRWRGLPIDGDSPDKVIEAFIADHPNNRNFFKPKQRENDEKK